MSSQYVAKGWLTEGYDYQPPHRGQLRKGVILKFEPQGIMVDLGLKRDGFIPHADVDRLEEETASELKPGQEVTTRIIKPGHQDSNHILSLYQVRFQKDWLRAKELLENGEVWHGEVTGYNRGGLLVNFGHLKAFVPSSQLFRWRNGRKATLEEYVGQEILLQVIFVDQDNNRLVSSERQAVRKIRQQNMDRLLNEVVEGETRRGTVHHMQGYGVFVDLGGAYGLIHKSELAWKRVRHPDQILQVGDEIDVYILHLDHKRKRIGLSLKRLQPNPWHVIQEIYHVDQLVKGAVTNLTEFGAFVALDVGVEGLVHISELADPEPQKPQKIVQRGDELVLRILSIDPFRQRMGLSLKRVSAQERDEWLAQQVPKTVGAETDG